MPFHFLASSIKTIWRDRISLFWPIWTATTVATGLLVIWLARPKKNGARETIEQHNKLGSSRVALISISFLALFLAAYIAGIMVWEDFAYFDNSIFTLGPLLGHDYPRPVWPDQGRFFPIGHQEFNVLRHFSNSVFAFHGFRIVELLLFCSILLLLEKTLSISIRTALVAIALITPSILISFTGLIYPEANVLLCLVVLVWAVKHFEESHSRPWAVAAIIAAQFLLYYKETAFLLVLGFAGGRLLFRCFVSRWDLKRLRSPESVLDLGLLLLVGVFFAYYLAAMYPQYGSSYVQGVRLPLAQILSTYARLDLLMWIFLFVVLARMFLIFRGKIAASLIWDSLALGGVACLTGYLTLRMESGYYLAPVDLIAILYLGRLAFGSMQDLRVAARCAIFAALAVVLLQDLSLSAYRIYERKNLIHAKAGIAELVKNHYENAGHGTTRLFFPYASPYTLKDLAGYFAFKGIPVEGVRESPANKGSLMIVGRTIDQDGPCQGGMPVCHAGKEPDPGDLVIVLPDDFASFAESSIYRQGRACLLFSYQSVPVIPAYFQPLVSRLHVISPVYPRTLPDHWLSASVAVWN